MGSILKVRMPDGTVVEVPALQGAPGKTPQRGVDYWTEEDKREMVADVVAALPVYDGEVEGE